MKIHRALSLLSLIVCAAAGLGCRGSTSSDLVATEDILADLSVLEDGSGSVYVEADLRVNRPSDDNYLHLVQGDSLLATFGNQKSTLVETGGGHYETSFALSNVADLNVAFNRTKYEGAKASGILPDAVDLGGIEGAYISRDVDTVIVQLPLTKGTKNVTIEGSCINTFSLELDEDASDIYLGPGSLQSYYADDECYVTMTVTTTSVGQVEATLGQGSSMVLQRARSTEFYSTP